MALYGEMIVSNVVITVSCVLANAHDSVDTHDAVAVSCLAVRKPIYPTMSLCYE